MGGIRNQRIEIKEKLETVSSYDFEVSLDRMKGIVEEWEIHYGEKGFRQLFLEYYQTPFSDHMEYHLYGWRQESDKEYKKRMNQESLARTRLKKERRAANLRKEEKEKAEYQRLKRKYEGEQNAQG